jgi:hypothetical protein
MTEEFWLHVHEDGHEERKSPLRLIASRGESPTSRVREPAVIKQVVALL